MNIDKTYNSVAGAAKDYFGGESASKFMEEWKQLTDQDKAEIRQGLEQNGYKFAM